MLLVFSITFIGFLLVKYVMFASSAILVNLLVMCLPFQFQTNNFLHFIVYCSRWYRYQKTYTPSFKQIFLRYQIINIFKRTFHSKRTYKKFRSRRKSSNGYFEENYQLPYHLHAKFIIELYAIRRNKDRHDNSICNSKETTISYMVLGVINEVIVLGEIRDKGQ